MFREVPPSTHTRTHFLMLRLFPLVCSLVALTEELLTKQCGVESFQNVTVSPHRMLLSADPAEKSGLARTSYVSSTVPPGTTADRWSVQRSRQLLRRCVHCTQVDEKFAYENRNAKQRKEIEKRMPHCQSTFRIQRNKMLFTNDARFTFTYLRTFRDCFRHVLL